MDIHPKHVFSFVSAALFFAAFIFAFLLPDEMMILGLSKINWVFLLIGSSFLVRFGWKVVEWFRRRDD